MLKLLPLILLSLSAAAQSQVPYVFSDGTPAYASEVNANFAALTQRLDALESEIAGLKSSNVAGNTYKLEISTTGIELFDADPQNPASDPGRFWNIDLFIEKYSLKFNDDAEQTAILEVEEDRGADLWQDGSMHFYDYKEDGKEDVKEVYYWTQTGSTVSLSFTPGGSSIVNMNVIDGALALYSIFSEQDINRDTGNDSCGNGTQRCYAEDFENSTLIGIRTNTSED